MPIVLCLLALKLLTWNIERGIEFESIFHVLEAERADVILLQEVDRNTNRTARRYVDRDLAARLRRQGVWESEFQELGQGKDAFIGNATLSSLPISTARAVRFKAQTDSWRPVWYLPNWSIVQPRIGGRVALVTEHDWNGHKLVFYNLHLESKGQEVLRVVQIEEVLEDAAKYPDATPMVIAGDLNVNGADSPVIGRLEKAGFRRAAGGKVTTRRGEPLDWIFVKGPVEARDSRILSDVRASDHFPVVVTITSP
jgi:endonuclease/exonuclease/phosphatase family metal-dependent hydrolase